LDAPKLVLPESVFINWKLLTKFIVRTSF
jgi:hypothetical protein